MKLGGGCKNAEVGLLENVIDNSPYSLEIWNYFAQGETVIIFNYARSPTTK